ncbi:uncharacterized protein [Rhodnius prolixus]|uniref:Salivary protein MYS1 n=1 Tax=Rhodnius prolixus TaxID=13249 RepID=Q7YSZ2_RHOPR|nr:salivary protein MYS1 precursor [Rhodnius prolixus]
MLALKLILLIPVLVAALDEEEIDNCEDGPGYRTCTPSFPVPADKKVTVKVTYSSSTMQLQDIEVTAGGKSIIKQSLAPGGYNTQQFCERPNGMHICLKYNRVKVSKGTDICYIISTSANYKYSSARCDRMTSNGLIYIPATSNTPK